MASRKGSKGKGNKYENEIAIKIRTLIPGDISDEAAYSVVHRTPRSGAGVERGDVIVKPPVWKWFPWFFECRNREQWNWTQVMKQGKDSIIGKWFMEDAVGKCHPYDGNSNYPRNPMLVFTRNFDQDYFMAWAADLLRYTCGYPTRVDVRDIFEQWSPSIFMTMTGEDVRLDNLTLDNLAVIGSFDELLFNTNIHSHEIVSDINTYLGEDNGQEESSDSS